MPSDVIRILQVCRTAEREQALFYRALASEAESAGDVMLAERLQELHADEQHHLSRLTARLLELGAVPDDLGPAHLAPVSLQQWETIASRRERDEVKRYRVFLEQTVDASTRSLVDEILATEQKHAEVLGGKWTPA